MTCPNVLKLIKLCQVFYLNTVQYGTDIQKTTECFKTRTFVLVFNYLSIVIVCIFNLNPNCLARVFIFIINSYSGHYVH